MNTDQSSALSFPCDFPIKVMGEHSDRFEASVTTIIERHTREDERISLSRRNSKGGRYTAITIVIRANSREQLDAIYRELTDCDLVLMAL